MYCTTYDDLQSKFTCNPSLPAHNYLAKIEVASHNSRSNKVLLVFRQHQSNNQINNRIYERYLNRFCWGQNNKLKNTQYTFTVQLTARLIHWKLHIIITVAIVYHVCLWKALTSVIFVVPFLLALHVYHTNSLHCW